MQKDVRKIQAKLYDFILRKPLPFLQIINQAPKQLQANIDIPFNAVISFFKGKILYVHNVVTVFHHQQTGNLVNAVLRLVPVEIHIKILNTLRLRML